MFTGIVSALGTHRRIAQPLGADPCPWQAQLTIAAPDGYLDDTVQLGDSIALERRLHDRRRASKRQRHRFEDRRFRREPAPSTAGARPSAARSTWRRRCAPTIASAATSSAAMSTASARVTRISSRSANRGSCGIARRRASWRASWPTRARSPSTASASPSTASIDASPDGCEISINLIPHTLQNTTLGTLKAEGQRRQPRDRSDRALCRAHADGARCRGISLACGRARPTLWVAPAYNSTDGRHRFGTRTRRRAGIGPHGRAGRRGRSRERRRSACSPPTT